MAINATAVWRIRPGGNNANGAGYDSAISGAGTDYSQQDAPQLSVTDIACSNNTTVTSVTGGFTTLMKGNAIRITGGGATSGYYFITDRTDTNTITVDRTPGTVSGGTGKVGGAAAGYKRLLDSANSTGDKVVAGNTVYIRGSGSDEPSVADYADETSYIEPVDGTQANGYVKVIGENGRPRFRSDGLMFYLCAYFHLENLWLSTSGTSNATIGILYMANQCNAINCVFHTNNQAGMAGIQAGYGCKIINTRVESGTTTPSSSTGAYGIFAASNAYNTLVSGCTIKYMRDDGINWAGLYAPNIENSQIYGCVGEGINLSGTMEDTSGVISNNTIHSNGGDGIQFVNPLCMSTPVYNNIITNNGGYGHNVASGTASDVETWRTFCDYNVFGSGGAANTSGARSANLAAGPNDVSADPDYADAASGDFTPQEPTLEGTAFPVLLP